MNRQSKFEQLDDSNWLIQKYINECLSSIEIGNIVGCSCRNVTRALTKYGIPVRNKSEGHRVKRCDHFIFNIGIINGSLLGDSSISLPNHGTGNSYLCKTNVDYEHLLYFANQIFSKNPESRITGPFENKWGYENSKPFYRLSTYSKPELTILRKIWYPDGIKIIPRDILLTKKSILHWFMDDGYSYFVTRFRGKKYEERIVRVQFATQSFSKNDLEFLCQKILELFHIKMTLRFHSRNGNVKGTGYFVEVSESQISDFFDLIGECPVDSLKYKWKRP